MQKIIVVDYGMGNLRSVAQALKTVAPEASIRVSSSVNDLREADRIILPGQGAMPDCMRSLKELKLHDALIEASRTRPLFGVCIGEQMLFDWSEEGHAHGLGLLSGKVFRFQLENRLQADNSRFKVPQMGWNRVKQVQKHPLWEGIPDSSYFYFVHSYYAKPSHDADIIGTTEYGDIFCSAVLKANLFATQFHPEKSGITGLQLYKNFINWNP